MCLCMIIRCSGVDLGFGQWGVGGGSIDWGDYIHINLLSTGLVAVRLVNWL